MKRKTRKNFQCYIRLIEWDERINDDLVIPPNTIFLLEIDFPVKKPVFFSINSKEKGLTLVGLTAKIVKAYKYIYDNIDKYQINEYPDLPPYRRYCDLTLHEIRVNYKKKTIKLNIMNG